MGPVDQRAVAAVLRVEPQRGEAVDQALVHERLGIAVGADDVPPPLVACLVGDQVVDVALAGRGQPHHPVVDQDQARAFVAVPAEERGGDLELGVEVRAEPLLVERDDLAGVVEGSLGIAVMLGEAVDPNHGSHRPAAPRSGTGPSRPARSRAPGWPSIVSRCHPFGPAWRCGDPSRRGDHLAGGQVDDHRVVSRLLVPGLVPGDERRSLPAPVVVVGQDRIPVQKVGDPLVIPPPAPLVGQVDREVDHHDGRSLPAAPSPPAGRS